MSNQPRKRLIVEEETSGAAMQFLALALFIMLLAFFIVLNASSTIDKKRSAPVIESLEKAFASKSLDESEKPSYIAEDDPSSGNGQASESIKGLLRSQGIPFSEVKSKGNDLLFVRLKKEDIIQKTGLYDDVLNRTQLSFLSKLVILLNPEDDVLLYKMEIFLGYGEKLDNNNSSDILKHINFMEDLATHLIKRDFLKKQISIGLQKGDAQYVDIHFKPISQNVDE